VQKVSFYHKEAGKALQGHQGFSADFRNPADPMVTRQRRPTRLLLSVALARLPLSH
jgi:hypothetical protein